MLSAMVRKKTDPQKGIGVPPPREIRTASLSLKVRPSLKNALAEAAQADGRTMAQYTERLLEAAMRQAGYLK
jgi:predicted HicB family RNase H-like nuclease